MIKRVLGRARGAERRDCEQMRATFSDYVDGELPPVEAARLEAHVGVCPRCRHAFSNLRVTLGGLARLRQIDGDDREAAERARRAWRAQRRD